MSPRPPLPRGGLAECDHTTGPDRVGSTSTRSTPWFTHPPTTTTTPTVAAASLLAGPRGVITLSLWLDIDPAALTTLPADSALLLTGRDAGSTTLAVASSDGLILIDVPTALIDAAVASRCATITFGISAAPPPPSWWARTHPMTLRIEGPTAELAAGIVALS